MCPWRHSAAETSESYSGNKKELSELVKSTKKKLVEINVPSLSVWSTTLLPEDTGNVLHLLLDLLCDL